LERDQGSHSTEGEMSKLHRPWLGMRCLTREKDPLAVEEKKTTCWPSSDPPAKPGTAVEIKSEEPNFGKEEKGRR